MKATFVIAVFPKSYRADGIVTEGTPEILTFNTDDIADILRVKSEIPLEEQRHWQIESIEFK